MDMYDVKEYVPGATDTVSPEIAAFTAAWIEPPSGTLIIPGLAIVVLDRKKARKMLNTKIVYKNNPLDIFKILRSSLETQL
jgi:hypothetical protein